MEETDGLSKPHPLRPGNLSLESPQNSGGPVGPGMTRGGTPGVDRAISRGMGLKGQRKWSQRKRGAEGHREGDAIHKVCIMNALCGRPLPQKRVWKNVDILSALPIITLPFAWRASSETGGPPVPEALQKAGIGEAGGE